MSYKIIKGSFLANHRKALVEAGLKSLKQGQKQLFIVVPNHIKFQEEVAFLKEFKASTQGDSFLQIQVFSFSRLAWYYLKNSAYYGLAAISKTAMPLLLKKVFQKHLEEFVILKSQVNSSGFLVDLQNLFQEFQEACVTKENLQQVLQQVTFKKEEAEKLAEIALLYGYYLEELTGYQFRETSLLQALKEQLQETFLQDTTFLFSGFQQFNQEEKEIIYTLFQQQSEVILDYLGEDENPGFLNWLEEDVKQLTAVAKGLNLSVEEIILKEPIGTPPEKLKKAWSASFTKVLPVTKDQEVSRYLSLLKAQTPYEEVLSIAKKIRRLIKNQNFRYQDITLLVEDIPLYGDLITTVFKANEIPFAISEATKMKDHPFVEFIRSLFAIEESYFSYQDIMRFLKTEFIWLQEIDTTSLSQKNFRNHLDIFENILLENGFSGKDFHHGKWHLLTLPDTADDTLKETEKYQEEMAKEVFANDFKTAFLQVVEPFFKGLKKATTGSEAATFFYEFLIKNGIDEKFRYFQQQAIDDGDLLKAKEHEQTWNTFCQLLEEYQLIYGKEPFQWSTFKEALTTGFETLTFDTIPPTLDYVSVEKLGNAMPQQNAYVFALGLNQEVLPKKIVNTTLLTDEQREKIQQSGIENFSLTYDCLKENLKENRVMLHLLTSGTKGVQLSYAMQTESSQKEISPFIKRIKHQFQLEETLAVPLQGEEDDWTTLNRLSTYGQLLKDFPLSQTLLKDKQNLHPFWQSVSALLRQSPYEKISQKLEKFWEIPNLPQEITEPLAEELYGKKLQSSVSKMEDFYDCQYRYFLNYGLQLKERQLFQLNPMVTGDFFHHILDGLIKILLQNNLQLGKLTNVELQRYLQDVLELALQEKGYGIFQRSQRMMHIKDKLVAILKEMLQVMNQQMTVSKAKVAQTEWFFDGLNQQGLKGPHFPLSKGNDLYLRGIIDRMDVTYVNEVPYLTVVDYKSSQHKFSFSDAYYGLALQMLTYLDVVLQKENEAIIAKTLHLKDPFISPKAAGALYLQVKGPTLKPTDTETDLQKQYRYQGLLVNEADLLEALDETVVPKSKSLIYPIEQLTKGPLRVEKSNQVTTEELGLLLNHNEKKLITAGEEILSGKIQLNPSYRGKDKIACQTCPFRSICRFDVLLKENNYQVMENLSKEEVLKKLKEQGGQTLDTNSPTA